MEQEIVILEANPSISLSEKCTALSTATKMVIASTTPNVRVFLIVVLGVSGILQEKQRTDDSFRLMKTVLVYFDKTDQVPSPAGLYTEIVCCLFQDSTNDVYRPVFDMLGQKFGDYTDVLINALYHCADIITGSQVSVYELANRFTGSVGMAVRLTNAKHSTGHHRAIALDQVTQAYYKLGNPLCLTFAEHALEVATLECPHVVPHYEDHLAYCHTTFGDVYKALELYGRVINAWCKVSDARLLYRRGRALHQITKLLYRYHQLRPAYTNNLLKTVQNLRMALESCEQREGPLAAKVIRRITKCEEQLASALH